MTRRRGLQRNIWIFVFLGVLPILTSAAAGALVIGTQVWPEHAAALRWAAIAAGLVTAGLTVGKVFYEFDWSRSKRQVRYDSVLELHNQLGRLMDITGEMALQEPASLRTQRMTWLRSAADAACAALTALVPENTGVRAVVYRLDGTEERLKLVSIGTFGRPSPPPTIEVGSESGNDLHIFLRDPAGQPELYLDTGTAARSGDSWGVRPRDPRRGS